jgi:putative hydrolase of the HAD superfamily
VSPDVVSGGSEVARRTPRDLELIAFDLDNTLYDEGLYYEAAFAGLVPELAERSGRDGAAILARLREILAEKGKHYNRLFTDVLAEIGLDPKGDLGWVLDGFRSVETALAPFPGVIELLRDLRPHYRLGVITSGMQRIQENKLRLLGIAPCFDRIVFSSSLPENKPGPMPFRHLLDLLAVAPERAAYVGDNPLFDFRSPNQLGMLSVRVHNPELDRLDVPPADDGQLKVERVTDVRELFLGSSVSAP